MARTKEFDQAAVLDKAMYLFWQKGYNGTSAQDLVDGLGISRSSLYDTFGDKRALFIKSLQQYNQKMGGAVVSILNNATHPEQAIRQIFESLVNESVRDSIAKGCFIVNSAIELAPHDKEVEGIVQNDMKEVEDALAKAVQKGQETGSFSNKNDARAMARFLFNNISGLRVAARAGKSRQELNDVINVLMQALN